MTKVAEQVKRELEQLQLRQAVLRNEFTQAVNSRAPERDDELHPQAETGGTSTQW